MPVPYMTGVVMIRTVKTVPSCEAGYRRSLIPIGSSVAVSRVDDLLPSCLKTSMTDKQPFRTCSSSVVTPESLTAEMTAGRGRTGNGSQVSELRWYFRQTHFAL